LDAGRCLWSPSPTSYFILALKVPPCKAISHQARCYCQQKAAISAWWDTVWDEFWFPWGVRWKKAQSSPQCFWINKTHLSPPAFIELPDIRLAHCIMRVIISSGLL
jgi:hypothetical protein